MQSVRLSLATRPLEVETRNAWIPKALPGCGTEDLADGVPAEEEELRRTLAKQPSDVTLAWDWTSKVFDVFLSHKVTDAKDVYDTCSKDASSGPEESCVLGRRPS